jgi:hypothetical protein
MKVDLDKYNIVSKVLLGATQKLIFQNRSDETDKRVLELKDVVAFIDNCSAENVIKYLRVDEEGGSYNLDISARLQQPEVNNFPQVLIFIDSNCVDFCFRAVARSIEFRDWNEKDNWLP